VVSFLVNYIFLVNYSFTTTSGTVPYTNENACSSPHTRRERERERERERDTHRHTDTQTHTHCTNIRTYDSHDVDREG